MQRLLAGEADPTLAGVATWADRLRDLDPARFKATSLKPPEPRLRTVVNPARSVSLAL